MRSVILAAAREWGVPPWVVEDGPAEWLFRWAEENTLRAELEKK